MYRNYKEALRPKTPKTPLATIQVCKTFTERVSIAGLEELNSNREGPVRVLFAIALVISTVLGCLTCFNSIQAFIDEKTSLDITFEDGGEIQFPNITICTTAVSNITAAKSMIIVPPRVEGKFMMMGANREELIDNVIQFMSTSSLPRTINQNILRYIDKTWTATSQQFDNQNDVVFRSLPQCSGTLSNCYFDGEQFDCCKDIVLGSHDGYVCYGVPIANRFGNKSQIEQIYKKSNTHSIDFNIDVKMDWRHIPYIRGDDAFDGFLVIVGEPYTMLASNPIAVVPGWHATIRLAQIKHRYEASECVSRSRLPNMAYMPYYDENGKNCIIDNNLFKFNAGTQCTLAYGNYFPNASSSCGFRQMYTTIIGGNGAIEELDIPDSAAKSSMSSYLGNHESEKTDTHKLSVSAIMLQMIDRMGVVHKNCYPICDRWQYEPIVGYAELRNENSSASDMDKNISWSKITVSIPSSYYEVHSDGAKSAVYVAMCNFGGASGMYLGVSMITFVQFFYFGVNSFYLMWKKRKASRVQPTNTPTTAKTS